MNICTVREYLEALFDSVDNEDAPFDVGVERTRSFEEHGLLTRDEGLVVDFTDGTRVLLTIQKG